MTDYPIKPIRILALQGGGIKGIVELELLKEIEKRTEEPISKLFTIISGTSVGSINAAMLTIPKEPGLAEPKYSAAEALKIMEDNAAKIFPQQGIWGTIKQFFTNKYDSEPLQQVLDEHLGSSPLKDTTTRVIMTVTEASSGQTYCVDSSNSGHNYEKGVVVRASAAAPTYLPAVAGFVDGGLNANRPANETLKYLKNGLSREEQIKLLDTTMVCAINFSKDNEQTPSDGPGGILGWNFGKDIITKMMQGSESLSTEDVKLDLPGKGEFFEISLPITKETSSLDDASPENIAALKEIARKYVEENSDLIDELCKQLIYNLELEGKIDKDEGFIDDTSLNIADEGQESASMKNNNKIDKDIDPEDSDDDEGFSEELEEIFLGHGSDNKGDEDIEIEGEDLVPPPAEELVA